MTNQVGVTNFTMIKDSNIRQSITFTKKQWEWIVKTSKELKMTPSKLIRFLISKNLGSLLNYIPEEEIQYLIKIAKTPWINDEDINE